MDWIERLLHVSPDGGSGWLEVQFLLVPIAAILIAFKLRRQVPPRR